MFECVHMFLGCTKWRYAIRYAQSPPKTMHWYALGLYALDAEDFGPCHAKNDVF